jgi:hypothetical protein
LFSRRRTVLEHSSVILAVECCKLGVGQSVITALFIVAIATSAKLPPGQYMPADDKLSIYLSKRPRHNFTLLSSFILFTLNIIIISF